MDEVGVDLVGVHTGIDFVDLTNGCQEVGEVEEQVGECILGPMWSC